MFDLIKVFVTDSVTEAYIVRDLLKANGIEAIVKDDKFMNSIIPVYSQSKGGIKIMVSQNDEEKAKEIISSCDKK